MANKSNEDTTDFGRTAHSGLVADWVTPYSAGVPEWENIHVLRVQTQLDLTSTIRGQIFPQGNSLGT